MINFLPEEAKAQLKTNYQIRVISVWLLLWGLALLLVTLFMVPTYVLVAKQFKALPNSSASSTPIVTNREDLKHQIVATNRLADKLTATNSTPAYHLVVTTLEALATADVRLTSFMIIGPGDGPSVITLRGVAFSEPQLSTFRHRITTHKFFNLIDISPKGDNADQTIGFTMQLTLNSI